MNEGLRRYSSIGNKDGILLLCGKVLTGKVENIPSVKASCSFIDEVDLNVNCGLVTLVELGLLKIDGDDCIGDVLIASSMGREQFITQLSSHCFNYLIDNGYLKQGDAHYSEALGHFYLPNDVFCFGLAVIRNLLISLSALIPDGHNLVIGAQYESLFSQALSKGAKVSQPELLLQLEREREMGEAGEQFALHYELRRCPFGQSQMQRIKQVSIIDTAAGYDIISFHNEQSDARRYIEVKTFVGRPHFHLSTNEVNAAQLRGDNYYIYLIDYSKMGTEGYIPTLIQNPYKSIFVAGEWLAKPDSFLVIPIK